MSCPPGVCVECGRDGRIAAKQRCSACYGRIYYQEHREAHLKRTNAWKAANPDKVKVMRQSPQKRIGDKRVMVRKKYGLTLEEYAALVAQPCALCGEATKERVCDHDHTTGRVRGALCDACNIAIGAIEGRGWEWIERARLYVAQI